MEKANETEETAIGGQNKDEFRQLVLVERGEVVLLNLEGPSQRLASESGKTLKLLNKFRHFIVFFFNWNSLRNAFTHSIERL
jgi:hypothetical protein